jgi:hypothetical protein
MPKASPTRTRAELLRERARLHRKMADVDLALASLETAAAPATPPSSLSTVDVVALALENAEVRATRRAG